MKKSLIALAFGTLALGIAEFVMMGILPDVARHLNVSIPRAGHLISAYALGVCCGAPMLTLARRYPLKNILLALAVLIFAGNLCAALAPNFGMLLAARFISGLPHGAYFGVASIVAVKLADEGRGSSAVSIMVAGMTIANLFGVPLGTALSAHLSWRLPFLLVVGVSLLVFYYIYRWVPQVEGLPNAGFKSQFRFLRHGAPWLVLGATIFGNGGIFCWYSYVNPLLTRVGGFPEAGITALMICAGFGMVVGNLVGGRLSDRFQPGHVAACVQGLAGCILLLIFFVAPIGWLTAILMCLCTACLFGLSSPQQVLIIRHAPGGEMLGAACIQVAFNLGNAVGAYCGGLPMEHGLSFRYPALVGAPFAFLGFCLLVYFCRRYERRGELAE